MSLQFAICKAWLNQVHHSSNGSTKEHCAAAVRVYWTFGREPIPSFLWRAALDAPLVTEWVRHTENNEQTMRLRSIGYPYCIKDGLEWYWLPVKGWTLQNPFEDSDRVIVKRRLYLTVDECGLQFVRVTQ